MRQKDLIAFAITTVFVLVAASIFLILPLMKNTSLSSPPINESSVIRDVGPSKTASNTVMATTTTENPSPSISREEAITLVRDDYSEHTHSITRIELTDHYKKKPLYIIELVPDASMQSTRNETVFIDAMTGDYYNPAQEDAKISIEKAKDLARSAFPQLTPDRVRMTFSDGSQYLRGWEFILYRDEKKLVQGSFDADTGDLSSYSIGITHQDRPETPSVTMDAAQQTANWEIRERNGDIPVVQVDARLDPLGMPGEKIAGKYVFVYRRVIHGVPCDSDGIVVTVDSVAGNVVNYHKSWSLNEDAVALPAEPVISRDAAIKTVQQEAEKIYPASADSLQIVSAELRWMDFHNPDKVIPKPGSVPLAWKVQFNDETIRGWQWPVPANGWVDAKTGTLLDLYYRH
ncbi:MAG: PepSY domain-containing protein [Methanoregula sp.]|jgi:Zn-dependent metalloprotease|nr:PepSY domain-containing protein [Methanoregula sp.]